MLRALFIYNHVIVIFINRLLHNIQCFDHSYLFYQGCQLLNIMSLLLVSRCSPSIYAMSIITRGRSFGAKSLPVILYLFIIYTHIGVI